MTELDKTVAAADAAGVSYGKYILTNGMRVEPKPKPKPEPKPEREPPEYTIWTRDMVEQLIIMRVRGLSSSQMASALGVTAHAVYHKNRMINRIERLEHRMPSVSELVTKKTLYGRGSAARMEK